MNNLQYFLPINNQYSTIDINKLKANHFKLPVIKRKTIEKSSILEISKYSHNLSLSLIAGSKDALIINSKELLDKKISIPSNIVPAIINDNDNDNDNGGGGNKPTYYKVVDMLNIKNLPSNIVPAIINDNDNDNGGEDSTKKSILPLMNQRFLRSFTTLDIELAQNQNTLYEFKSKTLNLNILNKNVYKILESSFFEMSSVISRPSFYVSPNKVIINLFYFVVKKNSASFINDNGDKKNFFLPLNLLKLQDLSNKLSYYFNKPIILELTQLYSISNNSQILAHFLGKLGLSRKRSFPRIINRFLKHQSKKIFFRNKLNKLSRFGTLLTGVYIKLGGRLMRGKIVPRRTVKKIQYGSLARCKSNYITNARYTQKNKRGSFSFTVSIGHKFF